MNQLSINNYGFSYGKNKVYQNFSLDIKSGINVIIGENGSGKTTLFKTLATIYRNYSGEILLNDLDYKDINSIKNRISYLPQDFDVYPNMKVIDFISFIAEIKNGKSKKNLKSVINAALGDADIVEFKDKRMRELSGGMRKRVGIAQALVSNVDMIIADEPTAALDPEQRLHFNRLLNKIADDKIIFISTHIIEDIQTFYDNIIILSKGKIKKTGSYDEIFSELKDKIYRIVVPNNRAFEIENEYKVLDTMIQQDSVTLTLYVHENQKITEDMEKISPTIQNVWSYYR